MNATQETYRGKIGPFTLAIGEERAQVDAYGRVFDQQGRQIGTICPHVEMTGYLVALSAMEPYAKKGGFRNPFSAAQWLLKLAIALDMMAMIGDAALVVGDMATTAETAHTANEAVWTQTIGH